MTRRAVHGGLKGVEAVEEYGCGHRADCVVYGDAWLGAKRCRECSEAYWRRPWNRLRRKIARWLMMER